MPFEAKILLDSVNAHGNRLTTFELTFPRCILAEFNTHRMISRNAASSRAIPTEKLIQRVIDDPFIPEFRLNQKGMQAGDALGDTDAAAARLEWITARDEAVTRARQMHDLNIHKQYVNRLLEPWMWATVIASATDWENVWHLRCSPEAEPSFQRIATIARDLLLDSKPRQLALGMWHLPMVDEEQPANGCDRLEELKLISAGRCARVSYLTHDGKRDEEADKDLAFRLRASGHWSPFEHVAMASKGRLGNFDGWEQYRKGFANENVPTPPYVEANH